MALRFNGQAAWDLLANELAVLAFSNDTVREPDLSKSSASTENGMTVQVITERAIERAVLKTINEADSGEQLDMAMFYLSDRDVI